MTFKQGAFVFLTGATVLSMSATHWPDTASDARGYRRQYGGGWAGDCPPSRRGRYRVVCAGGPLCAGGGSDGSCRAGGRGASGPHAVSRQAVADALYRDAKNRDEKLTAGAAGMGIRG